MYPTVGFCESVLVIFRKNIASTVPNNCAAEHKQESKRLVQKIAHLKAEQEFQ
jgi:hypothetical protein